MHEEKKLHLDIKYKYLRIRLSTQGSDAIRVILESNKKKKQTFHLRLKNYIIYTRIYFFSFRQAQHFFN